jgi:hypothetical protein
MTKVFSENRIKKKVGSSSKRAEVYAARGHCSRTLA